MHSKANETASLT